MPQRTDIFSLGRMGLTSGEGRRLELHTALAPLDPVSYTHLTLPTTPYV